MNLDLDMLYFEADALPSTPPTQTAGATEATTENEADDQKSPSAEVKKLRAEAAKWRVKFRDAEKLVKEGEPVIKAAAAAAEAKKTAEQKSAEKIAELTQQIAKAEATRLLAEGRSNFNALARKAGVSEAMIPHLSMESFNAEDEPAALEALKVFALPTATGGGAANSGKGSGAQKTVKKNKLDLIFGGR